MRGSARGLSLFRAGLFVGMPHHLFDQGAPYFAGPIVFPGTITHQVSKDIVECSYYVAAKAQAFIQFRAW
jgi:hypothetical protein